MTFSKVIDIDRVLIFYNAYTPPVQQHVYAFFPLLYAFCICSIPFYDRLRLGQTFSYFNRIFFGKATVSSDFFLLSTVFSSGTLRLILTFFFLQPYFLQKSYGQFKLFLFSTVFSPRALRLVQTFSFFQPYFLREGYGLFRLFPSFNRIFFGDTTVNSDFFLPSTVFSSGTLRLIQTFSFFQPYFLRDGYG